MDQPPKPPSAWDGQAVPEPEVPCGMYPPVPIDDLTLVRLFRQEAGEDDVSAAIAQAGADAAIRAMRQRQHAHTVALGLSPVDLHQRAELLELLYLELQIPEPRVGQSAIETDADRGRYFRNVVLRLLDREVAARLRGLSPAEGVTDDWAQPGIFDLDEFEEEDFDEPW